MNKEVNNIRQDINEIDKLIDGQDIDKLEAALDKLIVQDEFLYEIEEGKAFAKRIIKCRRKETYIMKKSFVAASIIGVLLMGATAAYASGVFNRFIFLTNKGAAVITTSENLTQEEAKHKLDDFMKLPEQSGQLVEKSEPIEKHYSTIEEAQKELEFQITLPSNMPEIFKQEKEVMVLIEPVLKKTFVYIIFDADTEGIHSMLKIDIVKETYSEGTSISVRQAADETYTTSNGIEYEITREQDKVTNAKSLKAKTYVNNYEYGIFTNGVEETTFYDIIDSIDISAYSSVKSNPF